MITFLPIAILAYALNGVSLVIDKSLIKQSIPNPLVYTFYVSFLQILVVFLIPFGFKFSWDSGFYLAVISGAVSVLALYAFFTALKLNAASIVGPIVGSLNPLFSAIIGGIFLSQLLTTNQYLAIGVLLTGALMLTFNQTFLKIELGRKFWWMVLAGLLFAISYVLLRAAFLQESFINVLIISRVAAGVITLAFLISPQLRNSIFHQKNSPANSKMVWLFLGIGQIMGAVQGLLLAYAVALASPAVVNSLFGVQYIVILIAAAVLYRNYPHLLDENLTKLVVLQKMAGVAVLSFGLYLLTQ